MDKANIDRTKGNGYFSRYLTEREQSELRKGVDKIRKDMCKNNQVKYINWGLSTRPLS